MLKLLGSLAILVALSSGASAQYAGFTPCSGKSLSVTTSSANVQLSTCGPTVILYNTTSQEAYYNIASASTTAATTSGYYIPGGGFIVLQQPAGVAWYLAGITSTSTTTFKAVIGTAKP